MWLPFPYFIPSVIEPKGVWSSFSHAKGFLSLMVVGQWLLTVMTDQPKLLVLGGQYIIYLSIHSFTAGVGLLLYGIYTAVGYTTYIRNMMIVAAVVFFLCLKSFVPAWGNHGIWLAYICTYLFESMAYGYGLKYLFRKF